MESCLCEILVVYSVKYNIKNLVASFLLCYMFFLCVVL